MSITLIVLLGYTKLRVVVVSVVLCVAHGDIIALVNKRSRMEYVIDSASFAPTDYS